MNNTERIVLTETAWMTYTKSQLVKHGDDWFAKTDMKTLKAGFIYGYAMANGWIDIHREPHNEDENQIMITFDNWDSKEDEDHHEELFTDWVMPEKIDSIEVNHDGGRLEIVINEVVVFYRCEGTRDCSVAIERDEERV